MKSTTLIILAALFTAACSNDADKADAYGNFEATEVIVSAETNGRILKYAPSEGSQVIKDDEIALIDTTLLNLQRAEIEAGMKSTRTRIASINAQNDILNQQIQNLNVNVERTANMLKSDAATAKQMDDLTGQIAVIEKQIAANNIQKASIAAELNVAESRKATITEQISRCIVKSPIDGTLLEKYAEAGEITAAGKPLARLADLSVMRLKVYVSGSQVANIKTGQQCTIRIDNGEKGYSSFSGTISYISGKAEFTPKIIQTKEERVTLVYAVLIDVKNETGIMKSGMPGEAIF